MAKPVNIAPSDSAMEGHPDPELQRQSTTNDATADSAPFVGRIGANGIAIVSRNSTNEEFLKEVPDAAPLMSLRGQFDVQPFLTIGLWKSALMEGVGMLCITSLR